MKYVKQFCIIIMVSLLGELLRIGLPFPIPASVYGMLLLFLALVSGVLKLEQIRDTALFLVEIMPVLFVSAGVGLMESWDILQPILLPVLIILLLTTIIVMGVAGQVTQIIIRISERRHPQ
ncbi:MAG: CidA/LrgA family protein [Eubacteriales bacterium]|nr:CidA/LrgA family protein [Eubacteriales bacterium]